MTTFALGAVAVLCVAGALAGAARPFAAPDPLAWTEASVIAFLAPSAGAARFVRPMPGFTIVCTFAAPTTAAGSAVLDAWARGALLTLQTLVFVIVAGSASVFPSLTCCARGASGVARLVAARAVAARVIAIAAAYECEVTVAILVPIATLVPIASFIAGRRKPPPSGISGAWRQELVGCPSVAVVAAGFVKGPSICDAHGTAK